MGILNIKKVNLVLAVVSIFVLTSVILFGVSYSMVMKSDGTMTNCLFTKIEGICLMTFSEHFNLWQNIFVFDIPKTMTISLSFLVIFLGLAFTYITYNKLNDFTKNIASPKLYQKQKNPLLFFDYLKEAFSQGILNPKIYI